MGDRKTAMTRCTGVGLVDAKAKFRDAQTGAWKGRRFKPRRAKSISWQFIFDSYGDLVA
jgi:hypothetical protein